MPLYPGGSVIPKAASFLSLSLSACQLHFRFGSFLSRLGHFLVRHTLLWFRTLSWTLLRSVSWTLLSIPDNISLTRILLSLFFSLWLRFLCGLVSIHFILFNCYHFRQGPWLGH